MVVLSMTACNHTGPKSEINPLREDVGLLSAPNTDPFEAFAELFSESASFAYAIVGGHKVLLVSQEVFGNNDNDGNRAIETSIFVQDSIGKIMTLGSIRSQGTLYPVSILDGKLMVAGHQFVKIYSIRGDVPELLLDSYQEGESQEMTEMFKTFEKGTPIKFKNSPKE